MSRRQTGRGRIKHDRLDAIMPATVRKSGNGTRQPTRKLNNDAWLQRQHTNNAYVTKKQNVSAETVMLT